MSTSRASTPQDHRTPRRTLQSLFAGAAIAALLGVSWLGCSFGWDSYDPRLGGGGGGGGAGSTGTDGGGPTTGAGGAGSSSSTGDASSSSGTGGASSSSSSGGTGGSGGGPLQCGGTSVLADDFSGGDPGEVWDTYEGGGAVPSRTGGEAVVALPNSPSGSYAEFDSNRAYDLRGDSISIEVASIADPSTSAVVWYAAGYHQNYVGFYEQKGVLHFEYLIAGTQTILKTTAYDPVAHRHWRFREDGQNTYWETSSDGASWTTMAQVPTSTLSPLDLVWIWFGGGTDGGEVNPGEIHFDRVNGGGPPKEKWCPVSSFKDDFNDGSQSLAWNRSWQDSSGMLAETDGKLVITLIPNSGGSASYVSSSSFDLANSAVLIEVPSAVDTADGSKTRIALMGPGDRGVELAEAQGHLYFGIKANNGWQEIGSLLYAADQHRWWRISESSNTLYWDTSPDGKAWVNQAKLSPVPFPIDVLDVYIGSDAWAEQPSPGVSRFDNLNLPPP